MKTNPKILKKYLKINYIFYISLLIILILYSHKNKNFFSNFFSLLIVMIIGYFIHYLSHNYLFEERLNHFIDNSFVYSNENFKNKLKKTINFFDFHSNIHHNTDINKKLKYQIYEFLQNIFFEGFIPFLFIIIARNLQPKIFILWGLFYATVHLINYNIIKPKVHEQHHINSKTNYGIELMDIIFNSKFDDTIENHNHATINLIILFLIFYFIKI